MPKSITIITGMHRSGTSLLAGMMKDLLGAELGKSLLEDSFDNPDGFYENAHVNALNDQILANHHLAWSTVFTRSLIPFTAEEIDEYCEKINQVVRVEFSRDSNIIIKDPRISILRPVWDSYLRRFWKGNHHWIFCVRDPREVARSLEIRNGFEIEYSIQLWCAYNRNFCSASQDHSKDIYVCFNKLISEPKAVLTHLLSLYSDYVSPGRISKVTSRIETKKISNIAANSLLSEKASEANMLYCNLNAGNVDLWRAAIAKVAISDGVTSSRIRVTFRKKARTYVCEEAVLVGVKDYEFHFEVNSDNEVRIYPSLSPLWFTIETLEVLNVNNYWSECGTSYHRIHHTQNFLYSEGSESYLRLAGNLDSVQRIRFRLKAISIGISAQNSLILFLNKEILKLKNSRGKDEVERLIAQYEGELQRTNERHADERKDASSLYEQEKKRWESLLNEQRKIAESVYENQLNSKEFELQKMTSAYKEQLKLKEIELRKIASVHDRHLNRKEQEFRQMSLCYKKQLQIERAKTSSSLSLYEKKLAKREKEIQRIYAESVRQDGLLDKLKTQFEELRLTHLTEIDDLKQSIEEGSARHQSQLELALDQLRSQHASELEASGQLYQEGLRVAQERYQREIDLNQTAFKESVTWRVGRIVCSPLFGLLWSVKESTGFLGHRMEDLRLGIALLKREGIKAFFYRLFWYLKGKRLLEEIPLKILTCGDVHLSEIEFNPSNKPMISIIIPVYNQWETTKKCLYSICENAGDVAYEVILADDYSNDETNIEAKRLKGLKVVKPHENLGFLKNCNHASTHAKGEYIFFLNNDAEIQSGALQALVDTLENQPKVGLVGCKLIFPNGKLQEAGGIIFSDASGWNYGRGDDPKNPEYNYLKPVDYCSGAAIAVRKDLWSAIGGFDERYSPAYYEDTDLAFEVRKRGFDVIYVPKSVVVHYEGVSHGTDLNSGLKKNQTNNQNVFREKWRNVLTSEHSENGLDIFSGRDRSRVKKTIVFVDHYVPFYDQDAGSKSTFQYVKVFLRMDYNVKFIGDNYYKHEPYVSMLQDMGVEVLYGDFYRRNWKRWFIDNRGHIDIVYLHRPHISIKYISFLKVNLPSARLMYQPHDLHFLRLRREAKLKNDSELEKQSDNWYEKESLLFDIADIGLTFSSAEKKVIREEFNCRRVYNIPLFAYEKFPDEIPPFSSRSGLIFVGGFNHPPNSDGICWFIREVMPLVNENDSSIKLFLVGSKMPDVVRQLESENVVVCGYLDDHELEELYQKVKIAVIPLRFGAGVKGKYIDAMYQGLPVVSSSIGVEGVDGMDDSGNSFDTPKPFSRQISKLHSDANHWNEASKDSVKCVRSYFSLQRAREVMEAIVDVSSKS